MPDQARQALSFGPAASEYDARRPSYPPAVLRWALGAAPRRVLDLGAGTGILTRVLLALGHDVVAVEPDAAMRAQLLAASPAASPAAGRGVEALAGSAEAIPLPDESVDAVTVGQAYHWFNREKAHPEIARVLRPGGVFAPVWNIRDESVPWVARLTGITDGPRPRRPGDDPLDQLDLFIQPMGDRSYGPLFGPCFGPVARHVERSARSMTADELVALMRTRSYYITATPDGRAEIDNAIRALTAELPETFDLPYVTAVYRAERR
ncbi:MAG TPA: class I SAM-dependent methyltransferase [Rugosimonospora sp.]|nr:class I SAM-dependent methyltransferase [Rugosimonospora sp.]